MDSVSASFKAEAASKDPYKSNSILQVLLLLQMHIFHQDQTEYVELFFPGEMNKVHKSWAHHPLQADKLVHRGHYIMHKFAGPWESGDTASLSKKSLLTLTARLGGPCLTGPL